MHSILKTDHYKLTMAEAGWPLRNETFYYSHRHGGPHLLPFDVKDEIHKLNPFLNHSDISNENDWLIKQNNTPFGAWFHGLRRQDFEFDIWAPAKGSWINDRSPMFVVSGPSFAVSWLEPLVLQLNYIIQIATMAVNNPLTLQKEVEVVTCDEQKQLILQTLENVADLGYNTPHVKIHINEEKYYSYVFKKVKSLIETVKDPLRIFEVGMRATSCESQHIIAVKAAKEAGLLITSDIWAAANLGLKSSGTMGHEHVQRYGSDEAAYRAIIERVPGSVFFLLDTFDTKKSGIPTAFKIISEQPERKHAIRFDSGDIKQQFIFAAKLAQKMGIHPRFCLEDSWNLNKTIEFENIRKNLGISAEQVLYGYGGYIINSPFTTITRDRVSAVWKLTQTGNIPTMKFGSSAGKGKESIPGKPILYWSKSNATIGQLNEDIQNMECAFSSDAKPIPHPKILNKTYNPCIYSPETKRLVNNLTDKRNKAIKEIRNVY